MRPALGLGIELSHPLGQKIFSLLSRAHVPHVYERKLGLPYARVLLVNPSTLPDTEADIVCVQTPLANFAAAPGARRVSDQLSARTAWLAHGPSMAMLMPRIRLALKTGRFVSAASEQAVAYVSEDDVALAGAAALASDEVPAGHHFIHGPAPLSHGQVVNLASEAFERPLALQVVSSPAELERALIELGSSAMEARAAREADSALLQGGGYPSNDTFSRITGLSPLSLKKYLAEQRKMFDASIPPSSTHVRVVVPPGLAAREVDGAAALRVSA